MSPEPSFENSPDNDPAPYRFERSCLQRAKARPYDTPQDPRVEDYTDDGYGHKHGVDKYGSVVYRRCRKPAMRGHHFCDGHLAPNAKDKLAEDKEYWREEAVENLRDLADQRRDLRSAVTAAQGILTYLGPMVEKDPGVSNLTQTLQAAIEEFLKTQEIPEKPAPEVPDFGADKDG